MRMEKKEGRKETVEGEIKWRAQNNENLSVV